MTNTTGAFTLNRFVALLTPLIAALAGLIVAWVGKQLPGVHLDAAELTALIASVVTSVLGIAIKWLDGWQRHEARIAGARESGTPLAAAAQRAA